MEILKDEELVHPADALAIALERASSLLDVLGNLYNGPADNFSGGNGFVIHALSTASTLLGDAQGALSDLHFSCDLTMLDHPDQGEMILPLDDEKFEADAAVVSPEPRSTFAEPEASPVQLQQQEQFARSYLELLKKLTAAEVFASEQQALSMPGQSHDLLPLLRGLREEFQKMHNVA